MKKLLFLALLALPACKKKEAAALAAREVIDISAPNRICTLGDMAVDTSIRSYTPLEGVAADILQRHGSAVSKLEYNRDKYTCTVTLTERPPTMFSAILGSVE